MILGDLNFRINLDNYTTRKLIKLHDYTELEKHDELFLNQNESAILKHFTEGALTFDPTYKYNFNSNEYDTSSKNRTPSWCDRILYEANSNLSEVFYGRAEINLSDHRPVFGLFEAKIRKENEKAKEELEQQLIQEFNTKQNAVQPVCKESSEQVRPASGDMLLKMPKPLQRRKSMSDCLVDIDQIEVDDTQITLNRSFIEIDPSNVNDGLQ